ncbi:type I restriction endonuclease subunit R, partial [bacterium AH-315-G05]|nr:type I restriction endonuclease subunit R [bacterium AH-315-G05]
MITPITPEILKEKSFQTLIKEYLINENGYVESFNNGYNAEYAIDEDKLFSFLEKTQEKEMNRLKGIYKTNYHNKVISNIDKNLRERGSIDVIKRGVKDYGVKLQLAYFKPATKLNPDQYSLYRNNILSVVEELVYEKKEKKRIDLVIFINGIPIITMELKNTFTGQTYKNAIRQYKQDRSETEKIFKFKERAIVNFAVDTEEAYITTRLNGESTIFLPFNKGNNGSAGNPPVCVRTRTGRTVKGKLQTHYLWEEVLKKDSLLEIIHKFTYVEKKEREKENGDTYIKETVIFPRYHQLDCVRKVINHAKTNGAGNKYLIQHSAGSGKTNSITWIAHRLASLHDKDDNIIFNGVIVITDRKVLDKQLQDSIYQLEHKVGLVAKIDDSSSQLAEEIEKGTKIIISTIQKFPFILDKLAGTKGKKYAIVIDEAHSSTSGRNIMALRESLSQEEALIEAAREDVEEKDAEDKINEELEKFVDKSNVSFFAFTATPKGTTLRLFGSQQADEKYYPFHIYSMKQAIEEGFILDVLKYYMTYKMYYNVNKKIEEDPAFDKSRATKSIVRYVSLHPHNISQKIEVIIEHFRNHTMKKIGGQAKAMLVTASRLHAVRYKLAFDDYIKRKGYSEVKTLVSFSGTVKDNEFDFTERGMNDGLADTKLPAEFDSDEFKVLIVANKYQTGYDQPKLHTMYVDKKLSGVKAVQTLSRLNRISAGKEDTFVLDFVNDPDDVLASFAPFYETTMLENDIEPNEIYAMERRI